MTLTTRDHLVPASKRIVSPGTNARTHLTIHETANTGRGANANAHARLQAGGNSRKASWHWQVDDIEAVRSYEHTAICIHAGNRQGSATSIAIEICVNSDGNRAKALANAAELAARICRDESIPLERIVQHHHWSGKNCPTGIRAGQPMGWASFLSLVAKELAALGTFTPPADVRPPAPPIPEGDAMTPEQEKMLREIHEQLTVSRDTKAPGGATVRWMLAKANDRLVRLLGR